MNNRPLRVILFAFIASIAFLAVSSPVFAWPLNLTYQITEVSPSLYNYDFTLEYTDASDAAYPTGTNYNVILFGLPQDELTVNLLTDWTYTSVPSPFNGEFYNITGPPALFDRTDFFLDHGFIPTTQGETLQWSGTSSAYLGQGDLLWRTLIPSPPEDRFVAQLVAAADSNIWDTNGSDPGSNNLGGNWSDANWTSDPSGNSATTNFSGTQAIFSAGDNATGDIVVTIDTQVTLSNIVVEEGNVIFQSSGGGTLSLGNGEIQVVAGQEFVLGLPGSGEITKTGDGLLRLNSTTGSAADSLRADVGPVRWMAPEQIRNSVYVGSDGTVDLNGQMQTLASFTNDGGTFMTGAGGKLIGTGNTITFGGGSTNIIAAGGLVQDANITVNNAGGNNTVLGDGGSTLGGGLIDVLGGGSGLQIGGGGNVNIDLSADATSAGGLQLAGGLFVSGNTQAQINSVGVGNQAGYVHLIGTPTIEVDATSSLEITAILTGTGFKKTGSGTATLAGVAANSYSGLVTVSEGTLALNAVSTNSTNITGDVEIQSTATLTLLNNHQINNASLLTIDGLFDVGSATETVGRVVGSGNININGGALTIAASQTGDAFDGTIAGSSGSFELAGGNLLLAGPNPFAGDVFIGGGTLKLSATSDLPNAPLINVAAGATFDLSERPLTIFATTSPPASADQTLSVSGTVISGGLQFTDNSSANILPGSQVDVGNFVSSVGNVHLLGDDTGSGPSWSQSGGTVTVAGSLLLEGIDTAYLLSGGVLNLSADTPTVSGPVVPVTLGDSTPGQLVGSGQFVFSGGRLADVNFIGLSQTANGQTVSPQLTILGVGAEGLLQSGGAFELGDVDNTTGHQTVVAGFYDQQAGDLEVDIYLTTSGSGVSDDGDSTPVQAHDVRDQLVIDGNAFLNGRLVVDFHSLTADADDVVPWVDYWNVLHVIDDDPATLNLILGDNFSVSGALYRVNPDGNGGYFLQVLTPEPGSLLVWCAIGLLLGNAYRRRRLRR